MLSEGFSRYDDADKREKNHKSLRMTLGIDFLIELNGVPRGPEYTHVLCGICMGSVIRNKKLLPWRTKSKSSHFGLLMEMTGWTFLWTFEETCKICREFHCCISIFNSCK